MGAVFVTPFAIPPLYGALADRPSLTLVLWGAEYHATDTGQYFKCIPTVGGGKQWIEITGGGGGGNAEITNVYACDPGLVVGEAVYLDGAGVAQRSDGADQTTAGCIGIVIAKPTPATAEVLELGIYSGFVGLTPGALYFVSVIPGQLSTVAPAGAGSYVQRVARARTATSMLIEPELGYEILVT